MSILKDDDLKRWDSSKPSFIFLLNPNIEDFNLIYLFIRGRQLEGTISEGPKIGVWPITAGRVRKGWGSPPNTAWTHDPSDPWPPKEPDNIDHDLIARKNRLLAYQRVRTCNECKVAIALMNGVLFAGEITRSWFNAPKGLIPMPNPNEEIIGSHAFYIGGYNDHTGMFKFVNSWGTSWGDEGLGYLSYEYFEKFLIECWVDFPFNVDLFKTQIFQAQGGKVIFYRIIPSALHSQVHVIEVNDSNIIDYKGWAFGVEYEGYLNIEELFVLPVYRRQGLATALISYLIKLSKQLNKPLRYLVPFADSEEPNIDIVKNLADVYGYKIFPAPVRWADLIMAHEVPRGSPKRHIFPIPGMVLPGSDRIPFINLGK
jgi:GNAT superfamily N-acetyltransferase